MKKENTFLFETNIKWDHGTKGILTSIEATDPIESGTPKVFKGANEGVWSPEDLLLGSLNSCFMTTFLFYAKQKALPFTGFGCEAIGQVELKAGKLKLTSINIYPKVIIANDKHKSAALEVIEATQQHCLISKAISVIIYYHPSIETGSTTEATKILQTKKREVFF